MHVETTRLAKRGKPILIAWPGALLMRWQAQRDTALAPSHPKSAVATSLWAGEEFRPGRRADLANVEIVKSGAVARQRIDVGRGEVGVAVDAQITPALVVGDEEDDIGAVRTDDGNGQQRGQGKKGGDCCE